MASLIPFMHMCPAEKGADQAEAESLSSSEGKHNPHLPIHGLCFYTYFPLVRHARTLFTMCLEVVPEGMFGQGIRIEEASSHPLSMAGA